METLFIKSTQKSPCVVFNPEDNHYEISGRSLPENVFDTYKPVLEWIDRNIADIKDRPIVLNIRLDYINTASLKMIGMVVSRFDMFYKSGGDSEIHWYYADDDDDMKSEGELFAKLTSMPIKLIST